MIWRCQDQRLKKQETKFVCSGVSGMTSKEATYCDFCVQHFTVVSCLSKELDVHKIPVETNPGYIIIDKLEPIHKAANALTDIAAPPPIVKLTYKHQVFNAIAPIVDAARDQVRDLVYQHEKTKAQLIGAREQVVAFAEEKERMKCQLVAAGREREREHASI